MATTKGESLEGITRALRDVLAQMPEVRLAYLFGSYTSGKARKDSDLDVAVRFAPDLNSTARGNATLRLISALTDKLGKLGERADILDLDLAGSGVAFRVIRDGQCLLARDEAERIRLVARIARRYDDDAPYRALFRKAAVAAGKNMAKANHGRS
jgi:predicted nucleotidyltransferase